MRYPIIIPVFILSVLLALTPALAGTVEFAGEYTYDAGALDSEGSGRTLAWNMVKRVVLEQLGEYLFTRTSVKSTQFSKDQLTAYLPAIVSVEPVDEKWDGKTYWIKARVSADPEETQKAVNKFTEDKRNTQALEDAEKRVKELTKESEKLKKEPKNIKAYENIIKGLNAVESFETGYQAAYDSKWKEALDAYTKAIKLKPDFATAYVRRGIVYSIFLGNHQQAIRDFTKAIENKHDYADAYFYRCSVNGELANYQQAIKDCTRAIEIKPDFAEAYDNRGFSYVGLGYQQAVKEYSKAIELDPKDIIAYFSRGTAYEEMGKHQQAVDDFKIAARWGDKKAQELLTKQGIQW